MPTPPNPRRESAWTAPVLVAALWVPAMIAASYGWRHGEYYDYGWFVPPAALWLLARRWRTLESPAAPLPWRWILVAAIALVPWLLALRILGQADPAWRIPMALLAVTAAACGHAIVTATHGWKTSASFCWITLLAMSAIPWPTAIEHHLVEKLTHAVMHAAVEWFQLSGRPVEIEGVRIILHGFSVEVTDGCSGVRSFQSFVMATWFFAELQRMRASRVALLLVIACGAAFLVNTVRTWALATIRFDHGVEAFDRAHDWLGVLAFLVSAAFFFLVSGWLGDAKPRRRLRRVRVDRNNNT